MKIGTLAKPPAGLTGVVDETAQHPDGSQVVRVNDTWWQAEDCRGGPSQGAGAKSSGDRK